MAPAGSDRRWPARLIDRPPAILHAASATGRVGTPDDVAAVAFLTGLRLAFPRLTPPRSPEPNERTLMAAPIFNPELRLARFLPRTTVGPRSLRLVRWATTLAGGGRNSRAEVVQIDADVSVRVFRPATTRHPTPALLWIHGGGMVLGTAALDDVSCRGFADELGIVVVSVDYRLAPEHPFPAPLDDCHTALRWLAAQPDVDADRIAIGGASAGAGLAAGLALLAKEGGEIHPVLQLLSYPMLDDRTTTRTDVDPRRLRMWNQNSNLFGWRSYLGPAFGRVVPPLAAPARYDDLSGVAPAWIGVGTNDLFHDEDETYARRLQQAGVACTFHEVPGAYHAFDSIEAKTTIARTFLHARTTALRDALTASN